MEDSMTDEKKRGAFEQWHKHGSVGGNKKSHKHAQNSRTSRRQSTSP